MLLRLWIQQNKLNNQNGVRFVWEVNSNTNYNTYCTPPECENPIHPTCIPFRKYPKLLLLDTRSNPNLIQGDWRTICLFMYTVYIITGIGETSSCVCHLRGAANCDNSRGISTLIWTQEFNSMGRFRNPLRTNLQTQITPTFSDYYTDCRLPLR